MKCALFVPGNQPNMHVSAFAYHAEALIFDCEDAVALDQKDSARLLVGETLKTLTMFDQKRMVRVNPVDAHHFEADVKMAVTIGADFIMLPKASVAAVQALDSLLDHVERDLDTRMPVFLIIESALAVETLWDIVNTSNRIYGLLLGGEDLMSDMHVQPSASRVEIQYARSKLVSVARAKHMIALDTPYVEIDNEAGLHTDTQMAKQLGYDGKVAIHPSQIDIINDIMHFSESQIKEAQAIVEAYQNAQQLGLGAFSYQGKMVDKPILERAIQILDATKGKLV